MADNTILDGPGTGGDTIATEDIGGVKYQQIKLIDGTASSTGVIEAGGGVEATALRVTIATDSTGLLSVDDNGGSLTVDNGGTFAVQADLGANNDVTIDGSSVVVTDDATYTLGTDTGVMMMGFAGTQSVNANDSAALACDTDGALHISDGGNSITIDGTVTETNSGTIAGDTTSIDGKITACDTGAVVISSGAVTETNSAAILADTANMDTNLITLAGAVAGTEIQVDIVSDGAGLALAASQLADGHNVTVDNASGASAVNIQDGGNSITIDGTVTSNLSATDNAVLDDIAAKLAPNASNGHSFYLNQDTNAVAAIKASAGTIYWITCMSTDATPVYLNLYNVASGSVTLGTTTPDMQFIVPSQGDSNGSGFTINFGQLGVQFGTAITIAAATTYDGAADPGANVVITNVGYE